MPSTWFRGAAEDFVNSADIWITESNIRLALVRGTQININRAWARLDEFLSSNTLVTDNPTNVDYLLSANRNTSSYVTTGGVDRWEFVFDAQVNFGAVNAGTPISGFVVYAKALSSSPANAVLWCCQELPRTGGGADVTLGTAGSNLLGYWKGVVDANNVAFRGTLDRIITQSDLWQSSSFNLGHALVRNTNSFVPTGRERTMSELASAVYCTNAGPSASVSSGAIVPMAGNERLSIWEGMGVVNNWDLLREKESAGGVQVKWPFTGGAGGNLVAGEVISAVVTFIYPTTGYVASTAYPINWDKNINRTIASGQDVVYGDSVNGRILGTALKTAA